MRLTPLACSVSQSQPEGELSFDPEGERLELLQLGDGLAAVEESAQFQLRARLGDFAYSCPASAVAGHRAGA